MNKNLLDLNLCIVKVLKHSYVYLNVLRNPEPNVALQAYRLCFKADNLYGVNGELWDGKPNEYITEETIEAARSDYKISKMNMTISIACHLKNELMLLEKCLANLLILVTCIKRR